MTDEPRPVSRDFRTGIAVATLGLQYTAVGLLLVYGDDGNELHTYGLSAMVWMATAVLLGIGVAGALPQLLSKIGK